MPGEINFGCSEEFAELCALSTSASLTPAEEQRLEAHVAVCAPCALLLNQYRTLASEGMAVMATMAAERASSDESEEKLQSPDHLKAKLLSALASLQGAQAAAKLRKGANSHAWRIAALRFPAIATFAAALLLALTAGFLLGTQHGTRQAFSLVASSADAEASLKGQLANAQSQLASANQKLRSISETTSELQVRSEKAQKDVKELEESKAALEARIRALTSDNQRQDAAIAGLAGEKDALAQKLRDSENVLQSVRQDLKAAQDDRQHFLLRTASLESQVDLLSAQVRERDEATHRSEQYLASDRDIRELMGARQLYIADVFDVDSRGETKKPFGRVFYTKGKSLVFYAFDLDQQRGYREAKAFQAWGRPGSSQATPVSLGIFYLDSEANRRWALKFEDPKVLDEIDALFVTVEPKGGSKHPTNKPFLLAYLHTTTPNHP